MPGSQSPCSMKLKAAQTTGETVSFQWLEVKVVPAGAAGWVPVLAWHYPDGCAFCGRNVGQMAGVTEKESAREIVEKPDTVGEQALRSKSHTTAASWCKWVPHGALKHVRNCQSVEAKSLPVMAGCEEWCQWIPEPAWRNPRGCRRCSQSEIIP